jgi:hypothetical protein
MQATSLSESEIILLQAVDALGGDVHISELKGAVRWQVRHITHKALGTLQERGLLNRYARGCYALTAIGRHALDTVGEARGPHDSVALAGPL